MTAFHESSAAKWESTRGWLPCVEDGCLMSEWGRMVMWEWRERDGVEQNVSFADSTRGGRDGDGCSQPP